MLQLLHLPHVFLHLNEERMGGVEVSDLGGAGVEEHEVEPPDWADGGGVGRGGEKVRAGEGAGPGRAARRQSPHAGRHPATAQPCEITNFQTGTK